MSKVREKGRIQGPFTPLLHTTMGTPAWKALSHGARSLYVALKSHVPKYRNEAFLSHRNAESEVGSSRRLIARWFRELEHYGFIVKTKRGSLGVDGRGKAPHWRLTELGATSKTSPTGVFEPPTNDFLRWDGTRFRDSQKLKPRPPRGSQGGSHVCASSGDPYEPHEPKTGPQGIAIHAMEAGSHGVAITSITTRGVPQDADLSPTKQHWTKPRVVSDEPRDSTALPLDEAAA